MESLSSSKMNPAPKSIKEEDSMSDKKTHNKHRDNLNPTKKKRLGSRWSLITTCMKALGTISNSWKDSCLLKNISSLDPTIESCAVIQNLGQHGSSEVLDFCNRDKPRSYFKSLMLLQTLCSQQNHMIVYSSSLEGDLAHNSYHRNLDIPLVITHEFIIDSSCKIIYICIDPKDASVSIWKFLCKAKPIDAESCC